MSAEHRACPFCGAREPRLKVLVDAPLRGTMRAYVSCLDCDARGPSLDLCDESMEAEDLMLMVQDATDSAWRAWDVWGEA